MRIGLFSDIHGNIYAFEQLLKKLKLATCDLHCFIGDICGYYYYAVEVMNRLREMKNLILVRGNHDSMFLEMLKDPSKEGIYVQRYGKSYALLKNEISEDNLRFLQEIPDHYVFKDCNIGIFHASPWDYLNEYIYPNDSLTRFQEVSFSAVFLGHTHYPLYRRVGNIQVINPGSCGQPRDMRIPSFAIFDTEEKKLQLKRIEYNPAPLISEIKKHKEINPYLELILKRVRN